MALIIIDILIYSLNISTALGYLIFVNISESIVFFLDNSLKV